MTCLFCVLFGVALVWALPPVSVARAAQAPNPCELLTGDEVQALVPKEQVGAGVATAIAERESFTCRYTWGVATSRMTLSIFVNRAPRMFAGMNADAIKQTFAASVAAGTSDATIPDVGDAAVFKAHSPAYATASAYLKQRILQIGLDGLGASDKKSELIALLKSAAARL